MYGYVYITTNLINNKFYIGQHKSETFDESYKGSGKYFRNALKKYGWDNFTCEVIEWCSTAEELDEKEIFYIEKYCSNTKNHYNLARGGNSGDLRKYLSEEDIENWKKSISNSRKGQHRSIESRKKQSQTLKGHITSDETRKKISSSNMGHAVSDYTRKRVSESNKTRTVWNKGHTKEFDERLAKQGKNHSKSMSGRRRIYKKGFDSFKMVRPEELQKYLDDGWFLSKN